MLNKNGFTLIEFIVAMVIVAIGAALAVLLFSLMIKNQRLTTKANHLLSTIIQLTHAEAIKRDVQVTLRHRGNTDGNWDNSGQKGTTTKLMIQPPLLIREHYDAFYGFPTDKVFR